jgi:dipeptidyl aminopeptidase/acylaminoacyl peptidase
MKTRTRKLAVIGTFVLLAVYLPALAVAQAQNTAPNARSFNQVAISSDGNRVAWVEALVDLSGEPTGNSAIYVEDLKSAGAKARRVSASGSNASEGDVAWSPDSRQLAFLSDAESPGQYELYVVDVTGGTSSKLTNLTGYLADPGWSPDGKTLAFLFTENAPRAAGPLMPMTPETGVIEDKVYEQRLTVADVASGKIRQLSPPDLYVYEYDWSPDGKSFVTVAAHGAGDANWYVAQLYTLTLASTEMKPLYKPPLQIAVPRWSPDGKNIAFIAGLMSDEGSIGGDIFALHAAGGEPRDVTPEIKASPVWISWLSPDKILFTENIDGEAGVMTVDVSSGKLNQVWRGPEVITTDYWGGIGLSLAADHLNSAVIRGSSTHPPEVWAGPIGEWKQVTHINQTVRPEWGELKSLHWMSDGMRIQGWLVYPKDYDPSRRYPMVVTVHGGPAGAANAGWPGPFFNTWLLSAHGYFVLNPNPRGSFGQGEAFTRANVKDFGYGDFRDILAGVDEVVKDLPVDNNRVGITGWSYGGYMTMWAVTQTKRFAAAVAGAGLFNFQSYYGENDIDEWMIPYFGASVYDDPAVYARSSPITFVKNMKTPALVLVGERDGEVPMPQSREFWHALKTLGVPTQLVIYPGEGHAILRPEHRRDIMQRLVGWFDRYLKPQ